MERLRRIRFVSAWAVSFGLFVAAGSFPQTVPAPAASLPRMETPDFAYDRTVPFDQKENSVTRREGAVVHDLDYAGLNGERLSAYLVTPPGKGPFAGVLFMHWLGKPDGNRDEFLDEAVILAKKGVVSLLVQGRFPWLLAPNGYAADRVRVIDQVVELRRALDLLISRSNVDPKRIGYVGHDFGAMYGGILSGIDKRMKASCLMTGTPGFSDWYIPYWPVAKTDGEKAEYRKALEPLDPVRYVAHAKPVALLFQFAKNDRFIPENAAASFFSAASEPKRIIWYEAPHSLNAEARKDRMDWLLGQLKK